MLRKSFKNAAGETLKQARLALRPKLTREQLAEKIGVSSTTIYRWETGRDLPTDEHLANLLKVLKLPPGAIFGPQEPRQTFKQLAGLSDNEIDKIALRAKIRELQALVPPHLEDIVKALSHADDDELRQIRATLGFYKKSKKQAN